MISQSPESSTRIAASLLRRALHGALATLAAGSGAPYCSLVNVATLPDGTPVILISGLALHTRNIAADPRVSLLLDEPTAGDPLEAARIMVGGVAERLGGDLLALARRRYLARHPAAELFVDFKDFGFFNLSVETVHLVAGFGRIVDLTGADVLGDLADAGALIAAEPDIVAHMNADHRDTMRLYATRLLGAQDADWTCTGCDPDGLDMRAGMATLRLTFPERVTSPGGLRAILKQLAAAARS